MSHFMILSPRQTPWISSPCLHLWGSSVSQVPDTQIDLFTTQKPKLSAEAQSLNLMALACVRGVGEVTLKAFLEVFKDLSTVWEASPEHLKQIATEARSRLQDDAILEIASK